MAISSIDHSPRDGSGARRACAAAFGCAVAAPSGSGVARLSCGVMCVWLGVFVSVWEPRHVRCGSLMVTCLIWVVFSTVTRPLRGSSVELDLHLRRFGSVSSMFSSIV